MDHTPEQYLIEAASISSLDELNWDTPVGKLCRADDLSDAEKCRHITSLDLSVRAYNVLTGMGIHTVAELLTLTVQDMMSARNMGRKSVWDAITCLHGFRHGAQAIRLYSPPTPYTTKTDHLSAWIAKEDKQTHYDTESSVNAPIASWLEADDPSCIHNFDWSAPLFLLCCPNIAPNIYHMTPIQRLSLSVRAFNCLDKSGFQAVEDVLCLTIEHLMKIQSMGVRSVWDILRALHLFCYSKTSPLPLIVDTQSIVQTPEAAPIPPPDPETALKELFASREVTSLTVQEAIDSVAAQCRMKEAKAHLAVIYSPSTIVIGNNILYPMYEDFNRTIQQSQFRNFRTLFMEALNSVAGERNASIVLDRYGFNGDACVLQELAEMYELTRERARQITARVPKRLMQQGRLWQLLRQPFDTVLSACGNVCRTNTLALALIEQLGNAWGGMSAEGYIELLADTDDSLHVHKRNRVRVVYRAPVTLIAAEHLVEQTKRFLEAVGEPVSDDVIGQKISEWWKECLPNSEPPVDNQTEILHLSDALQQAEDTWLLPEWRWAAPRTKVDHIYIILRENGSPMHFESIAEQYRQRFGEIKPKHAHSILSGNSDIFVLTGQGTYGLAEWGLTKIRWIGDIIYEFLSISGKPMTEEEIRQAVWKEREASANSIMMMLYLPQNGKVSFHRFGSKWGLSCWLTDGTVTEEDDSEKGRSLLQRLAEQRTDARSISQEENKLRKLLAQARESVEA